MDTVTIIFFAVWLAVLGRTIWVAVFQRLKIWRSLIKDLPPTSMTQNREWFGPYSGVVDGGLLWGYRGYTSRWLLVDYDITGIYLRNTPSLLPSFNRLPALHIPFECIRYLNVSSTNSIEFQFLSPIEAQHGNITHTIFITPGGAFWGDTFSGRFKILASNLQLRWQSRA